MATVIRQRVGNPIVQKLGQAAAVAALSGALSVHIATQGGAHGLTTYGLTVAGAVNAAAARTALQLGSAALEAASAFDDAGAAAAVQSNLTTHIGLGNGAHGLTTYGLTVAGAADAGAARTALQLGSAALEAASAFDAAGAAAAVQSNLTTHIGLGNGAHGISAFGATLVDDADAATARTTLGLGSLSVQNSVDLTDLALAGLTTDVIPRVTAAGSLADSALSDNGTIVSISRRTNITGTAPTVAPINAWECGGGASWQSGQMRIEGDIRLHKPGGVDSNTAVGRGSCNAVTTASNLTALGNAALAACTTGIRNVAVGDLALAALTTATRNVAVGTQALSACNGDRNVAIGFRAGQSVTTGQQNLAMGDNALPVATTSNNNTAIGYLALGGIITGSGNIGFGASAGHKIADGTTNATTISGCVYFGEAARASADGVSNEVVIGSATTGNGSNTVTIGNASVTANYLRGSLYLGETKVLGAQGAPVADAAAGAGTATSGGWGFASEAEFNAFIAAFNALKDSNNAHLARSRAHGLIAT
jgi:hypothetical protein